MHKTGGKKMDSKQKKPTLMVYYADGWGDKFPLPPCIQRMLHFPCKCARVRKYPHQMQQWYILMAGRGSSKTEWSPQQNDIYHSRYPGSATNNTDARYGGTYQNNKQPSSRWMDGIQHPGKQRMVGDQVPYGLNHEPNFR